MWVSVLVYFLALNYHHITLYPPLLSFPAALAVLLSPVTIVQTDLVNLLQQRMQSVTVVGDDAQV